MASTDSSAAPSLTDDTTAATTTTTTTTTTSSSVSPLLLELFQDPKTFTTPLPSQTTQGKNFLQHFYRHVYDRRDDYESLVRQYPDSLGYHFQTLVPHVVAYEDFWQRYEYRCNNPQGVENETNTSQNNKEEPSDHPSKPDHQTFRESKSASKKKKKKKKNNLPSIQTNEHAKANDGNSEEDSSSPLVGMVQLMGMTDGATKPPKSSTDMTPRTLRKTKQAVQHSIHEIEQQLEAVKSGKAVSFAQGTKEALEQQSSFRSLENTEEDNGEEIEEGTEPVEKDNAAPSNERNGPVATTDELKQDEIQTALSMYTAAATRASESPGNTWAQARKNLKPMTTITRTSPGASRRDPANQRRFSESRPDTTKVPAVSSSPRRQSFISSSRDKVEVSHPVQNSNASGSAAPRKSSKILEEKIAQLKRTSSETPPPKSPTTPASQQSLEDLKAKWEQKIRLSIETSSPNPNEEAATEVPLRSPVESHVSSGSVDEAVATVKELRSSKIMSVSKTTASSTATSSSSNSWFSVIPILILLLAFWFETVPVSTVCSSTTPSTQQWPLLLRQIKCGPSVNAPLAIKAAIKGSTAEEITVSKGPSRQNEGARVDQRHFLLL